MLTYGFYNSLNGDRKYDARDMSQLFDGFITDGVFSTVENKLLVKAQEEPNLSIYVDSGRAWLNGTWTYNNSPLTITIDEPEILMNRIDAVVLEINHDVSVRQNIIKIIKGAPQTAGQQPTKPLLKKKYPVFQYPLAFITVNADATSILQENIENCIGTDQLPFVTAVNQSVSVEELLVQWQNQWKNWMGARAYEWGNWYELQTGKYIKGWDEWFFNISTKNEAAVQRFIEEFKIEGGTQLEIFKGWLETNKDVFDTWFSQIQTTLDSNTAGALHNLLYNTQLKMTVVKEIEIDVLGWLPNDNAEYPKKKIIAFPRMKKKDIVSVVYNEDDISHAMEIHADRVFSDDGSLVIWAHQPSTRPIKATVIVHKETGNEPHVINDEFINVSELSKKWDKKNELLEGRVLNLETFKLEVEEWQSARELKFQEIEGRCSGFDDDFSNIKPRITALESVAHSLTPGSNIIQKFSIPVSDWQNTEYSGIPEIKYKAVISVPGAGPDDVCLLLYTLDDSIRWADYIRAGLVLPVTNGVEVYAVAVPEKTISGSLLVYK